MEEDNKLIQEKYLLDVFEKYMMKKEIIQYFPMQKM